MYRFWGKLSEFFWGLYRFAEQKRTNHLEKELDWLGINDLFIDDDEI